MHSFWVGCVQHFEGSGFVRRRRCAAATHAARSGLRDGAKPGRERRARRERLAVAADAGRVCRSRSRCAERVLVARVCVHVHVLAGRLRVTRSAQ